MSDDIKQVIVAEVVTIGMEAIISDMKQRVDRIGPDSYWIHGYMSLDDAASLMKTVLASVHFLDEHAVHNRAGKPNCNVIYLR